MPDENGWSNKAKAREAALEVRRAEVRAELEKKGSWPGFRPCLGQTLVKTYKGSQAEATMRFRAYATRIAADGYFPTTQSWAPGEWGVGAFIVAVLLCFVLIGFIALAYMLIVKPDGTLTVTYEQRTALADEKTCPACAERIKAAAAVCHFCGYKFTAEEVAAYRADKEIRLQRDGINNAKLLAEFPDALNDYLYRLNDDGSVSAVDGLGKRTRFPNWESFWAAAN